MIAIVQARTGSKRFPNKVLNNIYGKTLIEHVIDRLKKVKKIKKIIVATSNKKQDFKLISLLRKKKILFFAGSEKNVALRLYKAAHKHKKKYFIRINGDSPMIDGKIISKMISQFKKQDQIDILSNIFPRNFPKGQSVEIIKTKILKNNIKKMSNFEKEHVSKYFYKNHTKFKIKNFDNKKGKKNFKKFKFAIDTKEDLTSMIKRFNKTQFKTFTFLTK